MSRHPSGAPHAEHDPSAPGLPGELPARLDDTPPEYWRAFSITAFTMNRFIVDQVLRASRMFDNDIEAMVIFGALSHLNAAHLVLPGSRPSEVLKDNGRVHDPQPQLRPVRLRDLVQITGRPRETIRRKLDKLQAENRIVRVVDGWVLNVQSIDAQMHAQSVDGTRRFMEAAKVMAAALTDAEQALKAAAQDAEPTASSLKPAR